MDISSKAFVVRDDNITDRKTNQVRFVSGIPSASVLGAMHERTFDRKCREAFNTGTWPK